MRVFVTVAELGGFAPAARRLSLSPPVVTRAIASLEERVGTRLLQRTTRVVRLTEAGERYFADCQRILRDIEEAEASASSSHGDPRGRLVISASLTFGRMYVAPVVLDFLAKHPQISVRTVLADNVVDLIEEGVDVAVRIAHLADSSLTAIRVGTVRRVVCASPEYLAARGTPKHPRDVSNHDALVFSRDAAQRDWAFGPPRAQEKAELRSQLSVNNADVIIAAALAGRGLARSAVLSGGHVRESRPAQDRAGGARAAADAGQRRPCGGSKIVGAGARVRVVRGGAAASRAVAGVSPTQTARRV